MELLSNNNGVSRCICGATGESNSLGQISEESHILTEEQVSSLHKHKQTVPWLESSSSNKQQAVSNIQNPMSQIHRENREVKRQVTD